MDSASEERTAFWAALSSKNYERAKQLGEANPSLLHTVQDPSDERNALHVVANNDGDEEMAAWLLERGLNVDSIDSEGNTALHYLGDWESALEMADVLLSSGANPNIENSACATPLLLASRTVPGPTRYTDLLIKHRANPDVYSAAILGLGDRLRAMLEKDSSLLQGNHYQQRLLHDTIISTISDDQKARVLQILLEHGLNPNEHEDNQDPPIFMCCIDEEQLPLLQMLLAHGANVNTRDRQDRSVLAVATHFRAGRAVIEELGNAGAKE